VTLNWASDDVICGLTCDGCWDGACENVIASVIGRLMGRVLLESTDMLDATAKSSKEHGGKTTSAGVRSLPDAVGLLVLWKEWRALMAWQMRSFVVGI
jgi:hypothetical protein